MINPEDFYLERFLAPNHSPLNSNPLNRAVRAFELTIASRTVNGLIADPGSGLEFAVDTMKEKYTNQVYTIDCVGQDLTNLYGNLMIQLGFGHELVNWYVTDYANVLKALAYYLKETNFRPLFIFKNCDVLNASNFCRLLDNLFDLKGLAGFFVVISKRKSEKLMKNTDASIRSRILRMDDWLDLPNPEPEVLKEYCKEIGILSPRVTDDLLSDNPDFEVLQSRITKIREELQSDSFKKSTIK